MSIARAINRGARVLALCAFGVALGCASGGSPDQFGSTKADASLPSYEEIAARHNERAALLQRLWARAVVEFRYIDADGRRKREQGEGHLQFAAPSRFALSVGKLGEIVVYLGCDSQRFWWFERGDASRVSIARHENVGTACADDLGLPAHPLEIIELMGVTALPATGGRVQRSARGEIVVDAPTRAGFRRLALDPRTLELVMIGVYASGAAQPTLLARLEEYDNVEIAGRGGIPPRAASRLVITHSTTDTEIRINLAAMTDGVRQGRIPDEAFDFDTLRSAFGPREILVLDASCPRPALPAQGRR